jgi:hypothetical protein
MKMKRKFLFGIIAISVLAMCFFAASVPSVTRAETFDNPPPGAVKWKVIDYNRVITHPARIPFKLNVAADGGIGFDFLYTPDTALLGTSHPSYRGDLLGDLSGKTVSASVGVTVDPTVVFQYYGEPDGSGRAANVRLFFQTDTSGKFEETDYWWSNPMSVDLAVLKAAQPGSLPLAADISDGSQWSDYYGHFGNDPDFAAAFRAATKNVQFIGLSFGGGYFFENGVGIAPNTGSGYFRLMDFTVSPTAP